MIRSAGLAVLLFATAACASAPAAAPVADSAEREAILATVDAFLLSVGNGDAEARKALEMRDGFTYFSMIEPDKDARVIVRSNAQMMSRVTPDPFLERYWNPTVLVRGPTAQFWAPYVQHDNGEIVHCGIDALQLIKQDGKWLIASSMFTMEPGSCDALGLPSATDLRPMDGWKETPNR